MFFSAAGRASCVQMFFVSGLVKSLVNAASICEFSQEQYIKNSGESECFALRSPALFSAIYLIVLAVHFYLLGDGGLTPPRRFIFAATLKMSGILIFSSERTSITPMFISESISKLSGLEDMPSSSTGPGN